MFIFEPVLMPQVLNVGALLGVLGTKGEDQFHIIKVHSHSGHLMKKDTELGCWGYVRPVIRVEFGGII